MILSSRPHIPASEALCCAHQKLKLKESISSVYISKRKIKKNLFYGPIFGRKKSVFRDFNRETQPISPRTTLNRFYAQNYA